MVCCQTGINCFSSWWNTEKNFSGLIRNHWLPHKDVITLWWKLNVKCPQVSSSSLLPSFEPSLSISSTQNHTRYSRCSLTSEEWRGIIISCMFDTKLLLMQLGSRVQDQLESWTSFIIIKFVLMLAYSIKSNKTIKDKYF